MTVAADVQMLVCLLTAALRVIWNVYGWIQSVRDRAEQERLEQEEDDERFIQSRLNEIKMLRQGALRESIMNDPLSEPSIENRPYQYRGYWHALEVVELARCKLIAGAEDND